MKLERKNKYGIKVLDDKNLFEVYKQLYKNKWASGNDGVSIEEL